MIVSFILEELKIELIPSALNDREINRETLEQVLNCNLNEKLNLRFPIQTGDLSASFLHSKFSFFVKKSNFYTKIAILKLGHSMFDKRRRKNSRFYVCGTHTHIEPLCSNQSITQTK